MSKRVVATIAKLGKSEKDGGKGIFTVALVGNKSYFLARHLEVPDSFIGRRKEVEIETLLKSDPIEEAYKAARETKVMRKDKELVVKEGEDLNVGDVIIYSKPLRIFYPIVEDTDLITDKKLELLEAQAKALAVVKNMEAPPEPTF